MRVITMGVGEAQALAGRRTSGVRQTETQFSYTRGSSLALQRGAAVARPPHVTTAEIRSGGRGYSPLTVGNGVLPYGTLSRALKQLVT